MKYPKQVFFINVFFMWIYVQNAHRLYFQLHNIILMCLPLETLKKTISFWLLIKCQCLVKYEYFCRHCKFFENFHDVSIVRLQYYKYEKMHIHLTHKTPNFSKKALKLTKKYAILITGYLYNVNVRKIPTIRNVNAQL